MIVFDRDIDAFADTGYERWMVYDDALPDSAAVICRGISKREDASFIVECFENRASSSGMAYPPAPNAKCGTCAYWKRFELEDAGTCGMVKVPTAPACGDIETREYFYCAQYKEFAS